MDGGENATPQGSAAFWFIFLLILVIIIWGACGAAYLIADFSAAFFSALGFLLLFFIGMKRTKLLAFACGLTVTLWALAILFAIRGFERSDDAGFMEIGIGFLCAAAGALPTTVVVCRRIRQPIHCLGADGSPSSQAVRNEQRT